MHRGSAFFRVRVACLRLTTLFLHGRDACALCNIAAHARTLVTMHTAIVKPLSTSGSDPSPPY